MQKRTFLSKTAATLAIAGLALAGCTTTTGSDQESTGPARREINQGVDSTLTRLYSQVQGSRELVAKASGALVFPNVLAAGLGIGGEYGRGALRVRGAGAGYYSLASVSVGLQVGAQSKAVVFLFMTQEALDKFRSSKGWTAGVDASVAALKVGANGAVDINSATGPVTAFVLTNAGLMANLNIEGTKITRLDL
ncbi:MAG TPA: YSC84-related protein [Janthinobacterium sp.]|nr:YSC84-related protein [Janthinobacterium sp.]